jgi:hypothetical protein
MKGGKDPYACPGTDVLLNNEEIRETGFVDFAEPAKPGSAYRGLKPLGAGLFRAYPTGRWRGMAIAKSH